MTFSYMCISYFNHILQDFIANKYRDEFKVVA